MEKEEKRAVLWFVVVIIFGLAWVGSCISGSSSDSDSLAHHACETFHETASRADLMSFSELRAALQDVWDDAQYADDPTVIDAARDLLASATSLDTDAFSAAVVNMNAACAAHF